MQFNPRCLSTGLLLSLYLIGCFGDDPSSSVAAEDMSPDGASFDLSIAQASDAQSAPDAADDAFIIPADASLEPCELFVPAEAERRVGRHEDGVWTTVAGRGLTPAGVHLDLAGFPGRIAVHPQGEWAYVASNGRSDRRLFVINIETMEVIQDIDRGQSFDGLAVDPLGRWVASSGGDDLTVDLFSVGEDGQLTLDGEVALDGYPSGLAVSEDGARLWVGLYDLPKILEIDITTRAILREIPMNATVWDVRYLRETNQLFVSHLSADFISSVDLDGGAETERIETAISPGRFAVGPGENRLWLALSSADSIAEIDPTTLAVNRVAPAGTPLDADGRLNYSNVNAVAYDPATDRLFASLGAENAVSVLDGTSLEFLGAIPTGEYPTDVAIHPRTGHLLVSAGLGQTAPNEGRSAKSRIGGGFTRVDVASLALTETTAQVVANQRRPRLVLPFECDGFFPIPTRPDRRSPIEHVVLIVKENKTFDCVFGDLDNPEVAADPSLVRYGEDITPNQHALAREFALSDNFYTEVEDSDVGHILLTAGHVTEYVRRHWVEKDRSPRIADGYQLIPASTPSGGNLFTHLMDHDIDIAIFGEVVGMLVDSPGGNGQPVQYSDHNFPGGVYVNYEVPDEEKAEYFAELVSLGRLAQFSYILFPNDHTVGTQAGMPTPESMIADNDRAVGIVVDALSNSPLWEKTAVFIVQDDPQGCEDHIDAHRSFVIVASPWARRNYVSHVHATFGSVHATIERILGVPPMGRADGNASPLWDMFTTDLSPAPFQALPRQVPVRLNERGLPGADWSAQMDFRGPDRNPGLFVILDAYRLWRMGRISKDEAIRRIEHPRVSFEKWVDWIEESKEERFAFDEAMRKYRIWKLAQD